MVTLRSVTFVLFLLFVFPALVLAAGDAKSDRYGFINNHGICSGDTPPCGLTQEDMYMATEAGFGWMRLWLYWHRINPEQGVFEWEQIDTQFLRAKRAGLKIHWQILWAPAWATGGVPVFTPFYCMKSVNGRNYFDTDKPECVDPPALPDEDALREFVTAVIDHFGAANVGYLSCWNEPGDRIFWHGGWWTYPAHIQVPCYDAAHEANPAIKIVGPEEPIRSWLKRDLAWEASHGRPIFDVISFHLFSGDLGKGYPRDAIRLLDRQFIPIATAYRMIRYPNGKKVRRPIWMTATGAPSDPESAASLALQADAYEEIFRALEARPHIAKYTVYRLMSGCGKDSGILLCNGNPKPAWWRMRELIRGIPEGQID